MSALTIAGINISWQHLPLSELSSKLTLISSLSMSGYLRILWTGLMRIDPMLKQATWDCKVSTPFCSILWISWNQTKVFSYFTLLFKTTVALLILYIIFWFTLGLVISVYIEKMILLSLIQWSACLYLSLFVALSEQELRHIFFSTILSSQFWHPLKNIFE